MANTTISPNMHIPVPVPGVDPGIDWADNIVADMYIIDSHNHSVGQGVQITPDGLNIISDLPIHGNNLTLIRSTRFSSQASPLALVTDVGCLYESGVDLYFNDGAGNQIRMTQSGSPVGSSGTITGLPSGTASASYSAGTFTFQSATNTPASMNIGPIVTGAATVNAKTVTISASASLAADYAMTLPLVLPASTSFLNVDTSGNMGLQDATGTGAVVLTNSPIITSPTILSPTISGTVAGSVSGILAGGIYAPDLVSFNGTGLAVTASSFTYMRINNQVTVYGRVSGTTDNAGALSCSLTVPATTISVSASVNGGLSTNGGGGILSNIITYNSASTVILTLQVVDTLTPVVCGVSFRYTCA